MLLKLISILALILAAGICAAAGAFGALTWLWLLPVCFLGGFVALLVLFFVFFLLACYTTDSGKPQEHDSKFFRTMVMLIIEAMVKVLRVRIHTKGLEKAPKNGRFLLVCNHTSDADPVVLMRCFPESQLAFISKRENSTMFVVGKVMPKLMCQLVNRENDREALKTILKCIQLIKDDEVSVAVFPEGYIHDDRKLHHFRHGVFKIATKTNVPIVVCTLKNSLQILENLPKLKPSDVHMHLLDVIMPEQYEGMNTVEIGEMIYQMMADDLGPELVAQE